MQVRFVPYKDIDKQKWDECIARAANRLIYAHSFYLDAMAGSWDALVLDDYEAVMPLTHRKKFAIAYLYQPPFVQQLGVFLKDNFTAEICGLFEAQLLKEYSFAEITLNYQNVKGGWKGETKKRANYVLSLDRSYEAVYENYLPAFTKSLRRIKKFQLRYSVTEDYAAAIDNYKGEYGKRLTGFDNSAYANLKTVCGILHASGALFTREVYSKENVLLAGVVLMQDASRLYNIISFITDEGKKLEANYFMYDNIAQEFAGKGLLLDLEGSDVKGIANFYRKMSPVNEPYLFLKFNNLHPLIKMIKK